MRHWTRAAIYLAASGILIVSAKSAAALVQLADRLDDEQWFAKHKGSIVRITKHGVSTLERQ